VIGRPDPQRGTIVVAFVVLHAGAVPGPDMLATLQNHAKATIAPYKYPRAIEFLDALPRTQSGKLQRYRLK
jgi:2-aminobenzoate-CoA ligase